MSPTIPFLPTHLLREAQMNRMEGKAGRIVVSWNQFARNLKDAFHLYSAEKQAELQQAFDQSVRFIRKTLPVKQTICALAPYLLYLLLYSNYTFVRTITGLEDSRKVSYTVLPTLEVALFRCYPHRFLSGFASPLLDILAAIPYLAHFPLPVLYLGYLLLNPKRRNGTHAFMWFAGWVNLCTVIFQLLQPTAPPWFVDSAVFDINGDVIKSAANEAGFHRLDALLGKNFFHKIYSASPLKFGAFPSLHVAWPTLIATWGPWVGARFAWFHVGWIVWAAMYSNHHYGVDALGGILLVFVVYLSMRIIWNPFGNMGTRRRSGRRSGSTLIA